MHASFYVKNGGNHNIDDNNSRYQQSEKYLKSALEKIRDVSHEVVAEKWEPLLNNLGHTCRKLR